MRQNRFERRVRRSENPAEALTWWLEASLQRTELRNLALADDLGTLVSGAGSAKDCDELAAWAPIVLSHGSVPDGARALRGVKLPGFDAYVCTDASSGRDTELSEVAVGCARILGRREALAP